jgi:putative endonuclease
VAKSGKGNLRGKGKVHEDLAARFLEGKGHWIIRRNYHARVGEVDLITRDGETLVFVEVRMRGAKSHGSPIETVDWRKQQAIIAASERFLAENETDATECRFDVVGIVERPDGEPEIEHIRGAFTAGD